MRDTMISRLRLSYSKLQVPVRVFSRRRGQIRTSVAAVNMAFGLPRFCCFLDDLACEIFIYAKLPAVVLDDLSSFYDIVGAQGGIRVREPSLNGGYNHFGG